MRNAHFLLPEEGMILVDEMVKKTAQWEVAHSVWEPLRARAWAKEELSDEENSKKEGALKKMHEIQDWFWKEAAKRIQENFEPYLKLPPSV